MEGSRKRAYLSLGSNLGDRKQSLARAVERLDAAGVRVVRRSSLYETEPVGMQTGEWFLNCVVEVETELMPLLLLRTVKRIERELGRRAPAGPAPEPRPIDIDILLYGDHVVRMPELDLPHPRLAERRFVLEPLRELAPDWRHPQTGETAAEMLAALTGQAVRRLG
jgi:2-amino-4-hydroxy-6-hydroxymethyldihydropteridine diphosphokinase